MDSAFRSHGKALGNYFPTAQLSNDLAPAGKPVNWAPAAPIGHSQLVQIIYSNDTQAEIARQTGPSRSVLLFHGLPSGEDLAILSTQSKWSGPDLIVPASKHVTSPSYSRRSGSSGNSLKRKGVWRGGGGRICHSRFERKVLKVHHKAPLLGGAVNKTG